MRCNETSTGVRLRDESFFQPRIWQRTVCMTGHSHYRYVRHADGSEKSVRKSACIESPHYVTLFQINWDIARPCSSEQLAAASTADIEEAKVLPLNDCRNPALKYRSLWTLGTKSRKNFSAMHLGFPGRSAWHLKVLDSYCSVATSPSCVESISCSADTRVLADPELPVSEYWNVVHMIDLGHASAPSSRNGRVFLRHVALCSQCRVNRELSASLQIAQLEHSLRSVCQCLCGL